MSLRCSRVWPSALGRKARSPVEVSVPDVDGDTVATPKAVVGQVRPYAYLGGPIAVVWDGDANETEILAHPFALRLLSQVWPLEGRAGACPRSQSCPRSRLLTATVRRRSRIVGCGAGIARDSIAHRCKPVGRAAGCDLAKAICVHARDFVYRLTPVFHRRAMPCLGSDYA